MWPWGHLAVGYLLYSPAVHVRTGRAPRAVPVLSLLVGTQLPDLIDKPLAWAFHVVPQGYAVGHSVFVAVPVGIAVVVGSGAYGRSADERPGATTGVAFAVGWWSHLLCDVAVGLATRNPYALERVLWPVSDLPTLGRTVTAVGRVRYFLDNWLDLLAASNGTAIALAYVGPLIAAGLLWLLDGAPGVPGWRFPAGRE